MTPLNTIIEEEKKAITHKYDLRYFDGSTYAVTEEFEKDFTTAIQRAYEAGREERDTYWKERVRKEVEGMHTYWHDTLAEEPAIQVVSKNKLLQALDNLK